MKISIDAVKVSDRHRRDLGDVESLADSMSELGQLQPIVLTAGNRLVAGERRLEAARRLGWSEIDATVADSLDDAALLLKAERDENTQRKAFVPTEEHSLYEALLDLERESTKERQPEADGIDVRGHADQLSAEPIGSHAKQSVSEIVSGSPGRYKTLEKVGVVKRVAEDESYSEHVRKTAREALADMDKTGNVAGNATRVRLAAKADEVRRESSPEAWPDEERELWQNLRAGNTIVVSLRDHHSRVVQWARAEGLLVQVDRTTEWGNPFEVPHDGDRVTVIANYRDHYLPFKPSLRNRLHELRGKALACWCAPQPCHADVLKAAIDNDS